MPSKSTPHLSHFGVFCYDLDRMIAFYSEVFGMKLTDRGVGITMPFEIAFLSNSPTQHHQLALASKRPEGSVSTVMQISFKVQEIDDLRAIRESALARNASRMRGLNHGNALSIYFSDPEDNTVEVYLDTPWYVAQPHGDPLDLERSDREIWEQTEKICRADPTFMTVEAWRESFRDERSKQ